MTRDNLDGGFYFQLVPSVRDDDRKIWNFKCDTLDELNDWSHTFNDAIKLAATDGTSERGSNDYTEGSDERCNNGDNRRGKNRGFLW